MPQWDLTSDLLDLIDGACPLVPLTVVEHGDFNAKYRDEDDLTEVGHDEVRRAVWDEFETAFHRWEKLRLDAQLAVFDEGLGGLLMGRGDLRHW